MTQSNVINVVFVFILYSQDLLPQSKLKKKKDQKKRTILKNISCESYLKMDH